MCNQEQLARMGSKVSRRQFGAVGLAGGAAASLAACTSMGNDPATAPGSLSQGREIFDAPGGQMDGYFVRPSEGSWPGVILWPDIAGLREAKREMARRLAAQGYSVFVANPYYRSVAGEQFADFQAFRDANGFQKVGPWREKNTPGAVKETADAVVGWLDAQPSVDSSKGIANQGYCMTGSWSFYTAAARPDRVLAAASFHGGGLVSDSAESPHLSIDDSAPGAHFLAAIAQDDDAEQPNAKTVLRQTFEQEDRWGEVDVYAGDHGWTVLDSPSYNEAAAERAWARMLAIYEMAL